MWKLQKERKLGNLLLANILGTRSFHTEVKDLTELGDEMILEMIDTGEVIGDLVIGLMKEEIEIDLTKGKIGAEIIEDLEAGIDQEETMETPEGGAGLELVTVNKEH